MSSLLLDDRPLIVLPQLACLIGVSEAIFLQQIFYFNKDKDIDDDWFKCSVSEIQKKYFPFWCGKNISIIKNKLIKRELIQTKKRNKNKGDHTLSYRINKEKLNNLLSQNASTLTPMKPHDLQSVTPPNLSSPAPVGGDGLPQDTLKGNKSLGDDSTAPGKSQFATPPKSGAVRIKYERPEGVSDEIWAEFEYFRKAKKAPITPIVVNKIIRDSKEANMTIDQFLTAWIETGYQGFNISWIKNKSQTSDNALYKKNTNAQKYKPINRQFTVDDDGVKHYV